MDAKSILLVIGRTGADVDLQKAIDMATETAAHLSVLAAAVANPPSVGDYPVGGAWFDKREKDAASLAAQVQRSKERCAAAGLSFDVDAIYPEHAWADDAIAERARYADLTLIGDGALNDSDLRSDLISGALFASGRPIMLMPGDCHPTLRPKRVLLAWNGSPAAGRAARAVLGSLAAAEAVHLAVVDPVKTAASDGEEPGADMAHYLARHGANVIIDQIAGGRRPIPEVLVRHALDVGAELLVMGAYGHSRLRERIFGGVTQAMIDAPRLPVLMAH